MRRLSLMAVLLLAALLVSADPYRAEQHATATVKRRSRPQTNPGPEHEVVTVKEVASPIIIGLQDGTRQGGIRWLALGEKNVSLFHIDPQRLRRYLQ